MITGAGPAVESQAMGEFAQAMTPGRLPSARRLSLQPDEVKNGLGKLVLTLVELLRELLERQAVSRIEAGTLTEAEVERLGTTFLQLSEQMGLLKKTFGVQDDDLNIDLGPLGRLL